MGRKVTDGLSIDFAAPAGQVIEDGEMYCVDGITHFAIGAIAAADTVRSYAGDVSEAVYSVKVPVGTCGTRGKFVKWTDPTAFQASATDLVDEAAVGTPTVVSVAQVETVRNASGYARLRLVQH